MSQTADMHRFFDVVPGAFCLVTADAEERIAFASQEALKLFGCDDFAQFTQLTGGCFRGMAADGPAVSLCDRINCTA